MRTWPWAPTCGFGRSAPAVEPGSEEQSRARRSGAGPGRPSQGRARSRPKGTPAPPGRQVRFSAGRRPGRAPHAAGGPAPLPLRRHPPGARGGRCAASRCIAAAGGPRRRRAAPRRGHSARRHRLAQEQPAGAAAAAMAKEGAQRAEETEQMIEKEGGKEAAEGSAAGSLRAGDTKEMRAVVLSAFGGLNKLRVSKKAMPEPQEGELKIRVKAWSSIASRPLHPRGAGGCGSPWGGRAGAVRARSLPGGC